MITSAVCEINASIQITLCFFLNQFSSSFLIFYNFMYYFIIFVDTC